MNLHVASIETETGTDGFFCRATDSMWTAIERALDNGFGLVFVTGSNGEAMGRLTLGDLRQALRDGAHLGNATLGEIVRPCGLDDADSPVAPVLDERRRVVGIEKRPGAAFLPVAEPDLSHAELRNLMDAFLSTWISSTGEYITRFESSFAARTGMSHGVATSNGTVSLHLALAALGIGPGDEVIVPDLTFAASANVVIHLGATPVLVDVDPLTWCISPETIERTITPRTRAVMPVHVFGRPAPMTEIRELALRHGLFVIEDCAEAHGASYDGQPVGSFSDVASFSFFANKIVTTGEGGICVTRDPDLARRMRILRDHGMRPERRYWHEEAGYNFRMTNLQASIGCAQLDRMDGFLEMRRKVHEGYEAALGDLPGIAFPPPMPPRHEPVTWFSCALAPAETRPKLIQACKQANIDLRPFFHGLSSMPAYRRYARKCAESARLSACGINLPTSRKVDAQTTARIAKIFAGVLKESEN